jgi:hypothetical protein
MHDNNNNNKMFKILNNTLSQILLIFNYVRLGYGTLAYNNSNNYIND